MSNRRAHGLDLARASARSTGKFLAVLLVALCALMLGAHDAYAITVRDDGEGYKRAIVYPHDYPSGRAAALAEFLGYDWDSFSTQTKNAILEDNGKFKQLLDNNVSNYRYENQDDSIGNGSLIGAITSTLAEVVNSVSETIFGNDKTWYCYCTNADYEEARQNIEEWLYPHDNEPDVDEPSEAGYIYFGEGITNPVTLQDIHGNTKTVYFDDYTYTKILQWNYQYYVLQWTGVNTSSACWNLGCSNKQLSFQPSDNEVIIKNLTGESAKYRERYGYVYAGKLESGGSGNEITLANNATRRFTIGGYTWPYENVSVPSEPYEPTPDPTPTAPIIQIGDVTIDLTNGPYTINNTTYTAVLDNDNNWQIQITTNTTNNYGGDVQATDSTDYTSILNAILAAINSLRSEMTTYSNQVNTAINTMSTNVQTAIKNADTSISGHIKSMNTQMHTDIQTLQTNIQNTINTRWDSFADDLWQNMAALDGDLIEEMDAVARYIVEGIQFDADFSDANIVKWLKMIYARLKSKNVTVPSPDEDTEGWLEALKRILDELLDMILSGLNIATLATLFDGLKARFPISIPWDIAAIVNMFAGGAVTPVFDMPLPSGMNGAYTTLHIDLSEWDDEMALVRQGELLLFGIALMMNTKWIMDVLGSPFGRGK